MAKTKNTFDSATIPDDLKQDFVHLHCHSHYSFLDGGCEVEKIVRRAAEWNMPAVALTDHGVMCGAMDLYAECKKQANEDGSWKVKPIIGTEAYICDDHNKKKKESMHHLLLLAQNEEGYRNLVKLNAASHAHGYYYKPRIDMDLLAAHHAGLIVTSACLAGEVAQACASGNFEDAEKVVGVYRDIFGDRYYLEVQNHDIEDERKAAAGKLRLAEKLKIPFIATNDSHYLDQADYRAHDALLCICTGANVSDMRRFRFENDSFWFKDQQAMWETFPPEMRRGLYTTKEIADRCDVKLKFGEYFLPVFPDTPKEMTELEYMRKLAEDGCRARYPDFDGSDALRQRLDYEVGVIEKMGFPGYFLITADFIAWARKNGIPVGPGRGSAAGSIVAYGLGITDVDPLKYDLLFERFLNPSRISMPDIDVDFCPLGRERVIEYVREKYGDECVCQIITYNRLKAKAAVRDVGRVMEIPLADVDRIARLIPDGPGVSLRSAFEDEPKLREIEQSSYRYKDLFDIARRLEGLNRHTGIHAAGVIIAPGPLPNYLPLYRASGGPDEKPQLVSQYSMEWCEKLGLLKMDFLGLRNLTIIQRGVELVERSLGHKLNWTDESQVNLNDPLTYEMLSRGDAIGVFQLESDGMRKLLQRLQPDCFDDLIALLALYRPGPLQSGMVDIYVDVKHGRRKPLQLHESIDHILAETNSVVLYQEQVMRIANEMGGFSLAEADNLRKAMGKKNMDLMKGFRDQFVAGAVAQDIPGKTAGEIFDLMAEFASYGFNKSHSTAYAFVTFQTAWLKANWPVEYQAALMTCEMGSQDKLVQYLDDTRSMGICVRGPDVTVGEAGFTVVPRTEDSPPAPPNKSGRAFTNEIVFGLAGIKGVGEGAINQMVAERTEKGTFTTLLDFAERIDPRQINARTLETLIRAGALDHLARLSFPEFADDEPADLARKIRPRLVAGNDALIGIAQAGAADRRSGQMGLFGDVEPEQDASSSLEGLLPNAPPWADQELLAAEKETLGFFFSSHPLAQHAAALEEFATHDTLSAAACEPGTRLLIGGMVASLREITIRQGKNQGRRMASLMLEDLRGNIECVCFADAWEKFGERLHAAGDSPVVFLQGRADVREEKPQVIIDTIIPVDQVHEDLTQLVTIRLRNESVNDGLVSEMRRVFETHRGDVPVRMSVYSDLGRVIVTTGPRWRIRPSLNLRDALSDVLGQSGDVSFHTRSN